MGDRIGVIFHEQWKEFSPLLYSHWGAESIPFQLQQYLREYKKQYDIKQIDGHLYNCEHMMVGFIQSINPSTNIRIENLDTDQINYIIDKHEYSNCFDGGCLLIDVSRDNYGNTDWDNSTYEMESNNIVNNELINIYDYDGRIDRY